MTTITLENIINLAKEVFKENIESYTDKGDLIAELTDSAAFLYDSEYLELASRYMFLAHNKPAIVMDEDTTAIKIISANLCDHISNELHAFAAIEDEG